MAGNAKESNGSRSWWDRMLQTAVPGLIVAFVLGGITLGRSDAGQDERLKAMELRQDRAVATNTELREEIRRERADREKAMADLRAEIADVRKLCVEILKEVKK